MGPSWLSSHVMVRARLANRAAWGTQVTGDPRASSPHTLPLESWRTPFVMGRNVVATALGSVEAWSSPPTTTKTAGEPLTSPASEKDPAGRPDGAADGAALLMGRPVGLMSPEGFALLLGTGRTLPV